MVPILSWVEAGVHPNALHMQGPRGQRQGRGRSTTGRWRNNSGGRGQALHQGQGTVAAMHYPARHQTQTGVPTTPKQHIPTV